MKKTATTPAQSLVRRVIWRIESDLAQARDLTSLAQAESVSPFHLSRAFALVTGRPVIDYIRARRMTEAAKALRHKDARVTDIAFDAGYDTPEGFSRAFRRAFGVPPSQAGDHNIPPLQEAITMAESPKTTPTPRIVEEAALKIIGTQKRYNMSDRAKIPAQWGETMQLIGHAMQGVEAFGVCHNFSEESFDYIVGLSDVGSLDGDGLTRMTLPAGRFAVFEHEGHISHIPDTWASIYETWQPATSEEIAPGPEIERYAPDFDPSQPGGVAVWIPLRSVS